MENPGLLAIYFLLGSAEPEAHPSESFLGMCPNLDNPQVAENTRKCSMDKCEIPSLITESQEMTKINYVKEGGSFDKENFKNPKLDIIYHDSGTIVKCIYEHNGQSFSMVSKKKYSHCEQLEGEKWSFKCDS